MRNAFRFLSLLAVPVILVGCAGPTEKFSRGVSNMTEFARLGEIRRSMEQASIFDPPGHGGVLNGVMTGINRSFERTGIGIYEVLTFPIPNGKYRDYGGVSRQLQAGLAGGHDALAGHLARFCRRRHRAVRAGQPFSYI
jgi:putative exosortase-associated protein (TIGR04073 family)